jgi:hypothetical protein
MNCYMHAIELYSMSQDMLCDESILSINLAECKRNRTGGGPFPAAPPLRVRRFNRTPPPRAPGGIFFLCTE